MQSAVQGTHGETFRHGSCSSEAQLPCNETKEKKISPLHHAGERDRGACGKMRQRLPEVCQGKREGREEGRDGSGNQDEKKGIGKEKDERGSEGKDDGDRRKG